MALSLDGPGIHDEYFGRNTEQMPKLLADGREPMSVAHLMEQRLNVRREGISQAQHDSWWGNYFDNADLWLRHPDKGGKVVAYNAQVLEFLRQHLKPETELVDYALPLPDGFFEAMEGLELKTADIERLHTQGYTPQEAKQSDIWREFAREQKRLDNYIDAVVAETGRERNLMNTYFGSASKVPTGRLWYVYYRYNVSIAAGDLGLTSDYGRLVGVAPEAHVSSVLREARAKK